MKEGSSERVRGCSDFSVERIEWSACQRSHGLRFGHHCPCLIADDDQGCPSYINFIRWRRRLDRDRRLPLPKHLEAAAEAQFCCRRLAGRASQAQPEEIKTRQSQNGGMKRKMNRWERKKRLKTEEKRRKRKIE